MATNFRLLGKFSVTRGSTTLQLTDIFSDNYFDCCFSTEVFEHSPNINGILKKINHAKILCSSVTASAAQDRDMKIFST